MASLKGKFSEQQELGTSVPFEPDGDATKLLKAIEKIGLESEFKTGHAYLRGGFLRDQALGVPPNDADIFITFAGGKQQDLKAFIEDSDALEAEGFSNVTLNMGFNIEGSPLNYKATYDLGDGKTMDVDITIKREEQTVQNLVYSADAPINSAVMDSSGAISTHPDFNDHIQNKIYKQNPDKTKTAQKSRYKHLAEKIPGLEFVPP